MAMVKTATINNNRIYAFHSRQEFLSFIEDKKQLLVALNAEKLNACNEELTKLVNLHIGYPDGIGAVWALKRKGLKAVKIPGAEFWLDIIEAYKEEKSFYFIGGTESVITETIQKLQEQYPTLKVQGYRNGYLEEGAIEVLIQEFKEKKPDVVFVAMGSPKQEFLMAQFLESHPAIYMGLGGSFDVFINKKKRAPVFYQKYGLEWFYRLLQEPTRWRRQLTYISFSLKVIFNRI